MTTNILATILWVVSTNWSGERQERYQLYPRDHDMYYETAMVSSNKIMISIIDGKTSTNTLESVNFKYLRSDYYYKQVKVSGATNETDIIHRPLYLTNMAINPYMILK